MFHSEDQRILIDILYLLATGIIPNYDEIKEILTRN